MHPRTPPSTLHLSPPSRDRAYSRRPGSPPRCPSSIHRSSFIVHRSLPAFTLTELLIVIGIIVLFVTLALPAFNLISGGKSVAGAENELSALLARARNEAMGVQDYRGLAIYRDATTDRYGAAIVSFATYSGWSGTASYPQFSYVTYATGSAPNQITHYYVCNVPILAPSSGTNPLPTAGAPWFECGPNAVDQTSDSDLQPLPTGVGVQVINNCNMNGTNGLRASNGYLPIGVILFNQEGVLTAVKSISFAVYGHLGTSGNFSSYSIAASQGAIPLYVAANPAQGLSLSSSFGLVVFDKQSFETSNFYASLNPAFPSQLESYSSNGNNGVYQPQTTSSSGTGDGQADYWLDQNATPLLINRYNGTLIRSE
jgi:type II secretory pathway pseudopilin PulG